MDEIITPNYRLFSLNNKHSFTHSVFVGWQLYCLLNIEINLTLSLSLEVSFSLETNQGRPKKKKSVDCKQLSTERQGWLRSAGKSSFMSWIRYDRMWISTIRFIDVRSGKAVYKTSLNIGVKERWKGRSSVLRNFEHFTSNDCKLWYFAYWT